MKKFLIGYCGVMLGIAIGIYIVVRNPSPPVTIEELYSWKSIDVFRLWSNTLECDQAKEKEYIEKCDEIDKIQIYLYKKEKEELISNRKALDNIK